jgi:N-acyl-phosphatidylethanolamine-hydrolysing phospholipase D
VTQPGGTGSAGPRPDGGAPSLSVPAAARPAHHLPDGRFRNPWPDAEPRGLGAVLRWGIQRLVHGVAADPDPSSPLASVAAPPTPGSPPNGAVTVTWIGHATALVRLGGRTVLTDPMFGERASPVAFAGPRRRVRPGVPLAELPPVHTVVLSHNHYDHLDAPSVRRIARRWPEAQWHVPLRLARLLRALGVPRVVEQDWWQQETSGPLVVTATPAQHFSARTPFDRDRTLWSGWVIAAGGRRVFFAGDTGYHPAFGEIARRLGPFDVALLPIGAYEPRWFMRPAHMNPEEAVRAFGDLRHAAGARVLVPVHWGTFKLTDEPLDEPPQRTLAAWKAAALPPDALWLLRHGQTRILPS